MAARKGKWGKPLRLEGDECFPYEAVVYEDSEMKVVVIPMVGSSLAGRVRIHNKRDGTFIMVERPGENGFPSYFCGEFNGEYGERELPTFRQ